jgi:hypothetical protein
VWVLASSIQTRQLASVHSVTDATLLRGHVWRLPGESPLPNFKVTSGADALVVFHVMGHCCLVLNTTETYRQILAKLSNGKLNKNPLRELLTRIDKQISMKKRIVAFCNFFANAHNKWTALTIRCNYNCSSFAHAPGGLANVLSFQGLRIAVL